MDWYIDAFRNYANFNGRARRKAYWFFALFNFIATVLLATVDSALGTFGADSGMGTGGAIYTLAVFLPWLALSVRRLHDIGRSGWWLLVVLVPLVGVIILFVFSVLDSSPSENEYGPNPKRAAS